jgi:hypothetical protein
LQGIVTGRLGKSVREFYGMTLREIGNAINGFQAFQKEKFDEQIFTARIIGFWAFKGFAGKKLRKPEQLFELPTDVESRRRRLKSAKEVKDIQING